MISELKIRNFKSLESVDLKLGHFNLLVGANASGKSNFLDALRVLQGIGNGLAIDEVLDGKPPSDSSARWPGIRGGSKFATFRNRNGPQLDQFELHITLKAQEIVTQAGDDLTYHLACMTAGEKTCILSDSISHGRSFVFPENLRNDFFGGIPETFRPTLLRMSLFKLARTIVEAARQPEVAREVEELKDPSLVKEGVELISRLANFGSTYLSGIEFFDPLASAARDYSARVKRMSESGEGIASIIHEIETNGNKPALLEWLKELRPDEVDDIYALEGLNSDFMLAIKEGNEEFRAPILSEGTLRFIALAAAFFQPSMPKVLVIEEIEKGLHPSRLRLLLELMRSQSKRTGTQVFATTHSPTLLNWLTEEDRKTTFVCTRDAESGATKMRSLAEVPNLEGLIKKHYNLDQLFEEGWLESVLHES
ncbi:MAG: AAA family ATPase [Terracidiphilus sp.]